MTNTSQKISSILKYLNGHKRNIGWAITMFGTGLRVFDVLPIEQSNFIVEVGLGIGGIGTWHSYQKDGTINKIVNKFKK